MPLQQTCNTASAADFEFILTSILGQKVDSLIHKSLDRAGIDDVAGVTSFSEQRVKNLKHKDGTSSDLEEPPQGHQQLLGCFKMHVQMKLDKGIMAHEDWQNL